MSDHERFQHVLLIDEDPINNLVFQKLANATKLAKEITVFISALDALEYLKGISYEALPNAIFLDIRMPIMNGWEFIEEYKLLAERFEKKIPVFVVTTSSDISDLRRASQNEFVAELIQKPLSHVSLKRLLKAYA